MAMPGPRLIILADYRRLRDWFKVTKNERNDVVSLNWCKACEIGAEDGECEASLSHARGLCAPHYRQAREMISKGYTWWELEELNLAAPRQLSRKERFAEALRQYHSTQKRVS
jgi:hypothetical protein